MAFPQTPIELLAEMQIGGVWVDITSDLYARSPLTIERGRPDEAARVDPARATFQLNNRGNKYSPRNPRSSNFGLLGRNTPVRFSVPGLAEAYLSLDGQVANTASTPDHAAFAVTDLDLRAEVSMDWTTPGLNQTIMGQWGADGNRGWTWRILNGISTISWTTAGTSATQFAATLSLPPLPYRAALRTTLDVDNGAGGGVVSLYQARTLDGPWTLINSFTYVGSPGIFNSTAPLEIGPTQAGTNPLRRPFAGRGYRFQMMSGIGGSVVAAPDFRPLSPGTMSFADSAGRTWTLNGAASISNRTYRLHAEASALPPRWDVSGTDVYVPVEASGMMRRLGQGSKSLASTLRRRVPTVGLPVAYWPMEEGSRATQAYSPVAGVEPLATTGFSYAADSDLSGSDALPRINAAASMRGNVPAHTATGVWMVAMMYRSPADPASDTELLEWTTTGTARRIRLSAGAGGVNVVGYNAADAVVFTIATTSDGFHGQWNRLNVSASESGGNVTYDLAWAVVDGTAYGTNTVIAGTAGTVTSIDTGFDALAEGLALGHLGVFAGTISEDVYRFGDNGWNGETADRRHTRLCKEEGILSSAYSIGVPTTAMGPQRPDTLLGLLQEGALADGGILLEERERLALHLRPRNSFFNQPVALTLDYTTSGHVAPPLEPVDDDQHVRNDRTITRRNGSSARAIDETSPLSVQAPPLGVGTYDDETTLNLHDDTQPAQIAGWALHMGTWDEARYPTVHINLAAAPSLVPAVLALEIGDRIQIINPPVWLPPGPIDLIVEGYTETIGHPNDWDIILNCSPAGPWTVAVLDDTTLGRLDTAGAVLGASATSTTTTLLVHTTQTDVGLSPLWTEDPADMPVDLRVGGEVVTASAIAPYAADSFGRTVSNGWGTSTSGQVWATSGGSASDRSVGSGRGVVTLASSPTTLRHQILPDAVGDCEIRVALSVSAIATGASLISSITVRYTGPSDYYRLRVQFAIGGAIALGVYRDSTQVGVTETPAVTYTAGSVIQARVRMIGHRMLARVWATGETEPAVWHIDRTVTSSTITSGQIGLAASAVTGNTNVSPEIRFDDLVVLSPQRMTVTRSVNTIVKTQAAGEDVRLATPPILSL